MFGVETQMGIGMKNLGYRKPLGYKTLQALPGHPAPLTATSNHMQPALAYLEPKTPKTDEIAGYRVIVEVTLHHTPQPSPDFRQRLMHAHPQGGFHLLQLGEKSLPDGFAQHEELFILPRSSADVREPKEVERLRLALTPSLPISGVKGGMKLDRWGGGKLDQMSVWKGWLSSEGGVWSGGLRSGLRTAVRPERKTPSSARDVVMI